jgi:hypothetical protein
VRIIEEKPSGGGAEGIDDAWGGEASTMKMNFRKSFAGSFLKANFQSSCLTFRIYGHVRPPGQETAVDTNLMSSMLAHHIIVGSLQFPGNMRHESADQSDFHPQTRFPEAG